MAKNFLIVIRRPGSGGVIAKLFRESRKLTPLDPGLRRDDG